MFTSAWKVKNPNQKAITPEIDDLVAEVEEQVRNTLKYPDDGENFKAVFYRSKFDMVPFVKNRTKGTTHFVKVQNCF